MAVVPFSVLTLERERLLKAHVAKTALGAEEKMLYSWKPMASET